MENNLPVQTFEQENGKSLLKKLVTGEVNLMWKMLGVPSPAAARQRLIRDKPDAIRAAKQIIASRKKLIKEFKK